MSFVNLSKVNNWLHVVNQLPYLTVLNLRACSLPNNFPIPHVNSSTSLDILNLSVNNFTLSSSVIEWLFNSNTSVVELYLYDNQFQGLIPNAFSKINSLEVLILDDNEFEGGIPKSFSGMCDLKTLSLSRNNIGEQFLGIVQNLTGCANHSIEELYLDNNQIMGSFPDLTIFPSLRVLFLSSNHLSGTIPESLGEQSNLEILYIDSNPFVGVISEAHFSKLTKLKIFYAYNNSLVFNFSSNWVPPFQLEQLYIMNCQVDSGLPKWLQTQKSYFWLDLSNSMISDTLSNSYWIFPKKKFYMSLAGNQISGHIPNLSLESSFGSMIDLHSNKLEGEIPPFVFKGSFLDLSHNFFSKGALSLCESSNNSLEFLALQNNRLSGELPDCWMHFGGLKILRLKNNDFHGKIPSSLGSLIEIETLDFGNNNFSGELPSTLKNCTKLIFLDLRNNSLSGPIPMWLGRSHPNLAFLFLRSNHFYGRMPPHLCHLTHLQVLDLALNKITGSIPKCLNNLISLTNTKSPNAAINHSYALLSSIYVDQTIWMWKGREYEYSNILALVKGIYLSSNKLSGVIPEEIVMLDGLISLNLSRNLLTGKITSDIGLFRSLEVLDLSDNKLCGEIPSTLSLIDGLNSLNLRNNNLSGRIPTGPQLSTFNASAYEGNPNLCGFPLPKNCLGEETPQNPTVNGSSGDASMQDEKDGFITRGFYVSATIGFVVSFWGVCGTLLLNRSWRLSYFKFLNNIRDKLYVIGVVTVARLQRQLQS
ncbi:receptor-like protein EIX2 [Quercus suber]